MKRNLFVLALLLCFQFCNAQTDIPNPQVQKLVLTSSPAFVLLGVQPDNIQRPSTPRDFASNIQSAMVNGHLQPNFALEFNPFNWFKNDTDQYHSTHKNEFYASNYFSGKNWPAIKKNFAFSIASSSTDTTVFGRFKPGLGLGYGLRWTLIPGKVNKRIRNLFKVWVKSELISIFLDDLNGEILTAPNKSLNDMIIDSKADAISRPLSGNKTLTRKEKEDQLNDFISIHCNASNINALSDTVEKYRGNLMTTQNKTLLQLADTTQVKNSITNKLIPYDREGFTFEIAAAGVSVFQNNEWGQEAFAKWGIWLTPAYRFNINDKDDKTIQSFDVMGVLRYIGNEKKVDSANYFDLGSKLQFNRNKWNVSFEGTARYASEVPKNVDSNWTCSLLGSFSYTIEQNLTLKATFGSNFDGNTITYTSPKKIVALGGVNIGF